MSEEPPKTDYWQKVARIERKKAEDNLRLAAERASTIEELKDELKLAELETKRLRGLILNWYKEWGQNGMHEAFHALVKEAKEIERRP